MNADLEHDATRHRSIHDPKIQPPGIGRDSSSSDIRQVELALEDEQLVAKTAALLAAQSADSDENREPSTDHVEVQLDGYAEFEPHPYVPGEFLVELSKLSIWPHHPRRASRLYGDHDAALAWSSATPEGLAPIVVLPAVDGVHPILDGRFRYDAVRKAHAGRNEDVPIRCVLFRGSPAEAITQICDESLGRIGLSDIEEAHLLLSIQRLCGISKTAIAARYNRTLSHISNMTIAATMAEKYPDLFNILEQPDQAPISYGKAIHSLVKTLTPADISTILERATDMIADGQTCRPSEAFGALQIDCPTVSKDPKRKQVSVPTLMAEDILGPDDQPIGAYEQHLDLNYRLLLPADVDQWNMSDREAAAKVLIAQIYRHMGLGIRN